MNGQKLKVLDLFSGLGAFSLGLERAGFETAAFCEINPFCRAVLKKHWPEVPQYEDVCTLTADQIGSVDVITGGFPCQDISYAGKRAGITGKRSGLFREMVRAVRLVRPRFVIMENVAALLGGGMGAVLGAMADSGYDAEWDCVSASDLGAPHGRPRVWLAFTDAHGIKRSAGGGKDVRRRIRGAQETAQATPDNHGTRQLQPPGLFGYVRRWIADGSTRAFWECDWQTKFEALRRMDDGSPTRLDRSRDAAAIGALGNAVLPQIPEAIGRAILETIKGAA